MSLFISSDLHIGHKNIVDFEPRRAKVLGLDPKLEGWDLIEAHDDALIARFNERLTEDDTLLILGDFGLAASGYLKNRLAQFKGKQVLVLGNHDKHSITQFFKMGFSWVCHQMKMKIAGEIVVLSHYPYRKPFWKVLFPWQYKEKDRRKRPRDQGHVLLHGHIHSGGRDGMPPWVRRDRMINIGCDVWDYYPIPWSTLEQMVQQIKAEGEKK